MARSANSPLRPRTLAATLALGFAALAPGACGLDRSGLEGDFPPPPFDARFETIDITATGGQSGTGGSGAAGSGGGGGGGMVGTGGGPGVGGNGVGGNVGAGGKGQGGTIGTGGNGMGGNVGTGGKGQGGTIGTGGSGQGGMGVGGAGTGGSGQGGMGTGGSGSGGNVNGDGGVDSGGMGGVGGQIGVGGRGAGGTGALGGAGGMATVCIPSCGPCERCTSAHTCEIDPNSLWDLSAVSATLNPIDPFAPATSTSWDVDGEPIGGPLPDPYCQLEIPSRQILSRTATITDSLTPNWSALTPATRAQLDPPDSPLRAGDLMLGGQPWLLSIGDDDVGVEDPALLILGETLCQINGPLTAADFRARGFSRTNVESCFSATFKLTCRP